MAQFNIKIGIIEHHRIRVSDDLTLLMELELGSDLEDHSRILLESIFQ